jgi:2-desacetyl-2-hydroxyethyl bacteriochlorophyllide A dehydrogenase
MSRVVRFAEPGVVTVVDYEDPPLEPSQVRIETLYSGISAGTELTAYRGSNPYTSKRWDERDRMFMPGEASFTYPIDGWGYEEVGRVTEAGPDAHSVNVGDIVYGTWGHRSTATAPWQWAARRILAPDADPQIGLFSRIGAIALNGVLDADIHVGEYVAVFGQGPPGLIAGQLARLNGATVIAVDTIPKRLELATLLGAQHVVDVSNGNAGEAIRSLTAGRGADVSIEITGSYHALHEAVRSTAYNSRVVACGFFQGEGIGLFLGEEFHHNRIEVVCSQISGVSPRVDHRWDLERLEKTVMSLAAQSQIDFKSLITQVFPVESAAQAFELLATSPQEAIQVVLDFTGESKR